MSSPEPFDLIRWREPRGLAQHAQTLHDNGGTREMAGELTNDDLRHCGIDALEPLLCAASAPRLNAHALKVLATPVDRPRSEPPPPRTPSLQQTPEVHRSAKSNSRNSLHSSAATTFSTSPAKRTGIWVRILASKFLVISIVAHLVFGVGTTYFIVQRVQAKRKVAFQGGPPAASASKRALEHKVSLAQKKKTGGAPPQAKRIVSAGLAKVALPDLPSIPTASTVVPGMMAGMGGGVGAGPDAIIFVSERKPTDACPSEILKEVAGQELKAGRKAAINTFAYMADGGQESMEHLARRNGLAFMNIRSQ